MADAIDDGLIKALEEIVAKDRTGFGRAALANVAREALSRHKAPLSVAEDDAERVARVIEEYLNSEAWEQDAGYYNIARAAIAALQARPSAAGDDVCYIQACKAELDDPDWQPNRAVWADLCDTALALTALQVTEGDEVERLIEARKVVAKEYRRLGLNPNPVLRGDFDAGVEVQAALRSQSNKVSKPL